MKNVLRRSIDSTKFMLTHGILPTISLLLVFIVFLQSVEHLPQAFKVVVYFGLVLSFPFLFYIIALPSIAALEAVLKTEDDNLVRFLSAVNFFLLLHVSIYFVVLLLQFKTGGW